MVAAGNNPCQFGLSEHQMFCVCVEQVNIIVVMMLGVGLGFWVFYGFLKTCRGFKKKSENKKTSTGF